MPEELNAASAQAADEARAARRPEDPGRYGYEGCCVRTFWAVVETDGTFVRGRNVARVARLDAGQYEVVFTSDVNEGVYVATMGRHPRPRRRLRRPRLPPARSHPLTFAAAALAGGGVRPPARPRLLCS